MRGGQGGRVESHVWRSRLEGVEGVRRGGDDGLRGEIAWVQLSSTPVKGLVLSSLIVGNSSPGRLRGETTYNATRVAP